MRPLRRTLAAAALAACMAAPFSALAETMRFEAELRGANVALQPVDTGAHGWATAILDGNTLTIVGSFVSLSSELRDIDEQPDDPGIHVHPGAEGETSPTFTEWQSN